LVSKPLKHIAHFLSKSFLRGPLNVLIHVYDLLYIIIFYMYIVELNCIKYKVPTLNPVMLTWNQFKSALVINTTVITFFFFLRQKKKRLIQFLELSVMFPSDLKDFFLIFHWTLIEFVSVLKRYVLLWWCLLPKPKMRLPVFYICLYIY